MKNHTKKSLSFLIVLALIFTMPFTLFSCKGQSNNLLDPNKPTTLTMWHVYGEQSDSPMNACIEEFNATEGRKKGVIIDVAFISNSSQIGKKLKDSQMDKAGSPEMPDLFFCHPTDAINLGSDNLVNWKDYFSDSEIDSFVTQFVLDGIIDDKLCIFPVSKSTNMLYVAGGVFERFAQDNNVSLYDLETWQGFFNVAKSITSGRAVNPFALLITLFERLNCTPFPRGKRISTRTAGITLKKISD